MRNLTQEINAQRRSSESTPHYMSTEREAHLLRDQLESSTNKMFDTINANFIRLVISNLKALPISSLLWKRQDVSVGEEDGYVTAGYGPRKGERRLLPLPTLLIHLITRPSGWLKAGCMATWHAVTPTPLSDEGFVLCYRTVNFWGNSEKPRRKKKKKKTVVNLIWVRSPTTAFGILKPDLGRFEGRDEADAICETQALSPLCSLHTYNQDILLHSP